MEKETKLTAAEKERALIEVRILAEYQKHSTQDDWAKIAAIKLHRHWDEYYTNLMGDAINAVIADNNNKTKAMAKELSEAKKEIERSQKHLEHPDWLTLEYVHKLESELSAMTESRNALETMIEEIGANLNVPKGHSVIEFSSAMKEKVGWISVDKHPEIGGEYNVVWDLEDGHEPVVTTMEWDNINKEWVDTIGDKSFSGKVILWMPLPETPKTN